MRRDTRSAPFDARSMMRHFQRHTGPRLLSYVLVLALVSCLVMAPGGTATAVMTAGARNLQTPELEASTQGPLEFEPGEPKTLVAPPSTVSPASVTAAAVGGVLTDSFETWPGEWTAGSSAGPTWGQTDYRASDGSYSAYCAGSSIPAPGPYANDMFAWLMAGPFDLSTYSAATLSFDLWLVSETDNDEFAVGVSTDGANFDVLTNSGDSGGWDVGNNFDLSDFYGDGTLDYTGESEVWVAFFFSSNSSATYEGAYVDDVELNASGIASDAYEPDDSYDAANAITVDGAAQQHTIHVADDEDWVSFSVTSGLTYTIETADGTPADSMDTLLGLYDSDGTTLIDDNDDYNGLYSLIEYTATASKTVYARALAYGAGTGAYALQVTSDAGASGDSYEPDNSYATASAITVDAAAQQHTIHVEGDEDWVSFSVTDDWSYTIETADGTPADSMDTYLQLYDSDGTSEIAYNDDDTGLYSRIDYEADESKTVYARVTGYGGSSTGAYALQVTSSAPPENTPPVAVANSYQTNENTKLTISAPGVLGNDTDADFDSLTAQKVTNPSHGAVSLSSSGGFTYTPTTDWFGTDSFTYRAYDGEDYSNTVAVTITVKEVVEPLPPIIRVEGDNRYATAVEASKLAYPNGASTVVIATGQNWPDALGGSALAGALDGPILLTKPDSLNSAVLAEVKRLGAKSAIILGGTSAVSSAVENTLRANLSSVSRIAGSNRYDTANQVARRVIGTLGAKYDGTAFVATGENFPDALAAAPLAAANKWPLFLVKPGAGISGATRSAMAGVKKVIILGGTAAVSSPVETDLRKSFTVTRLAGKNRYSTAVTIATYGVGSAGLGWNRAGIATGVNYPDALAGGVLQGKVGSVMLLTPTDSLCNEAGSCLLAKRASISTVTFFGGAGAVSQATRTDVQRALDGTWSPTTPTTPVTPGAITEGTWHGIINGTSTEGVTLNVRNGKITTEGSALPQGAAMIVRYPYSNVTITNYVYADIPIVNNSFSYTSGSVSTIGGLKTVNGTFSSGTRVTGSASHEENSFGGFRGSMDYDWTATR